MPTSTEPWFGENALSPDENVSNLDVSMPVAQNLHERRSLDYTATQPLLAAIHFLHGSEMTFTATATRVSPPVLLLDVDPPRAECGGSTLNILKF